MSTAREFLAGGGEMGARIREYDWAHTMLGPVETWPQSLRSAVSIMLPSKAQIAICWGPDLVFLYNDGYRPVLGGKHPWALGRPIRDVWDELWRAGLREIFSGVLATGEAFWAQDLPFFMERYGYLEETYFDVSYDPIRDESGRVGGLFCIVSEKTGRVIGERRLRTLRDVGRVSTQTQTTQDAFSRIAEVLAANAHDLPLAVLYAKDEKRPLRVAASCGIDAGRLIDDASGKLRAEGLSLVPTPAIAQGEVIAGPWPEPVREVAAIPLAGTGGAAYGWLACGVSPRLKFDDDYRGFLETLASGIVGALDNARRSEDERRRAEMLAQIDRAKTAFFSNVSHEFRTPLTLLMGPVADALADPARPLDDVQKERLQMAHRSALRLQKLVNSLLDFARTEAGRAQANYSATDLGALTAELASSFRGAMEKAGLRFTVDCACGEERAYVDRDLWEKLVLNLLSNAFKFTFEGEVAVSVRRTCAGFELRVRDTGVGIPAAELPRIFERFHRVEGTRSRTHEGSGIGLALVHDIAAMHGGHARVESVEGEGSCFIVMIPAGFAHLDAAHVGHASPLAKTPVTSSAYVEEAMRWLPTPAADPTGEHGLKPRVVLADDNADMRDYLRNLLSPAYEVECVPDGMAALETVRAKGADLVLSDVMMPRLDGIGLVQALRMEPTTAKVPVILLSARAGEAARIEGLGAGADDYLEKPFGARELLARVAARLEIARVRRDSALLLEDREEQLRVVTDHAPVMLLQIDAHCRYAFLNETAAARYGGKPHEFIGRTMNDVLAAESFARIEPHVRQALAGHATEFDERISYPAIGERWMHCNYLPQRDRAGRPGGFVAVLQDITERKLAELRLQEQARRFEKLNEVGLTLAAESDLEGVVQVVTDIATELSSAEFGAFFYNVVKSDGESYMLYTLSGVPREHFSKFPMPRNTRVFGPTFAGEGIVRVDDITVDPRYGHNAPYHGMPKGHLPVRSYLAVPVISRAGEVLGGLFFGHSQPGRFSEAAERTVAGIAAQAAVAIDNARLHEQRLRLIGELRDSDRRKDEFIATLSHELRNPLAPLRSGLDLLQLGDDKARHHVLPMLTRQVNHLVRLVDDLLEASRINRGTLTLRKECIELRSIVQHAAEAAQPIVSESGHTLEVLLPDRDMWLEADAARVAQVLTNLLTNAARYTDRGGRIVVEVAVHGGDVHVSVRDTGMGFVPDEAERLFEMFARGDRSQGLGIGLALARRLAQMHGGSLTGSSEGPGRGATFTLSLPLGTSQDAPTGAERTRGDLPPIDVLVVDDNRDAAETLQMLLDVLGVRARVAHDGAAALGMFETEPPDAVLLDIGMPGMDGYEVARRLRARHPEWAGALIALSGWGQEADRRKGQQAGFDHHLVKPVELDALRQLLSNVARA